MKERKSTFDDLIIAQAVVFVVNALWGYALPYLFELTTGLWYLFFLLVCQIAVVVASLVFVFKFLHVTKRPLTNSLFLNVVVNLFTALVTAVYSTVFGVFCGGIL